MLDGNRGTVSHRVAADDLLPVFLDPAFNKRMAQGEAAAAKKPEGPESTARAYDNIPCSAGQNNCYISPYGDVYPCVQMPVATGNLRRQAFRDIWYGSPQMSRVRSARESMVDICPACSIKEYCQRCPGLAQMEDGDMLGPSSRACELAELAARVAGVPNPVSALHALERAGKVSMKMTVPRASNLVTIAPLAAV
jgi:radical SAM protein with 4Fe4S-binding SPASM domain